MRHPLKTFLAIAAVLAVAAALARTKPAAPPSLTAVARIGGDGFTTVEGAPPRVADVEIARDRRHALVFAAPGRWTVRAVVPPTASLRFALDVDPPNAPVSIRLARRGGGALDEERWKGGRGWSERRIDVTGTPGEPLDLELTLAGGPAAVSIAHPEAVAPGVERPNVLVYVIDCLRADHVGAYGYSRPTTPEIDRLAQDGVVFEDVQSCASWTKPAVGCLFTSLYPVRHGAQTVDDVLDPSNPTLAEAFRGAGYATAAWVANPFVAANPFGLTRGFDRVLQTIDKPPLVNINDLHADAADITRDLVPWLEAHRDRQLFVYAHSLDLHAEYRRRPPFDRVFVSRDRKGEERQVDLYDNELAYNDREVGRLVAALKRLGLYDRTIVVVTADHGEEFGEHGFTRHGHTLFQALLHVPLVVKLPASRQRGLRVPALASSLDIAPTLLDLAGVTAPPGLQGTSLRPALDGRPLAPRSVFAEQLSPKEVLYAARAGRFKYVYQLIPEPEQRLYDLTRDPAEATNLFPMVPEAARGLLADLALFMQVGQAGYHVSISGADPEARYRIEAETPGAFADVQRFSLAAGEKLTLSPDRKRLDYTFSAGTATRHLVLRTDPPDADVRLSIAEGGHVIAPEAVALAADGHHPAAVPFAAQAAALGVSLSDAAELMKTGGAGVRAWYVQPLSRREKAAIDPDLEQKLKALGYIE